MRNCRRGIPGIGIEDSGREFLVTIPDSYRVGHEAHFAQVAKQFFKYLKDPQSLPKWERPNMLAKYFVASTGVELSRPQSGAGSQPAAGS